MLDDKEFLVGVYRKADNYIYENEPKRAKIHWMRSASAVAAIVLIVSTIIVSTGNNTSQSQIRNDEPNLTIASYQNNEFQIDGVVTEVSVNNSEQLFIIRTDVGRTMELNWYGSPIEISVGSRMQAMVIQKDNILIIQSIIGQEN